MSYSFIIGKHESVKIIVFTYIAIVAGQGLGNIIEKFSLNSQPLLTSIGLSLDITVLDSTKLIIFVAVIILLSIKGGFTVSYGTESGGLTDTILTGVFGFATGGLLLSTLLTFVAGAPLLDASIVEAAVISPILKESNLMQIMVVWQDLWFSLPALLLIGLGLVSNK